MNAGEDWDAFARERCDERHANGERCYCPACRPDGTIPLTLTRASVLQPMLSEDPRGVAVEVSPPGVGESMFTVAFTIEPEDDQLVVDATTVTTTDDGLIASGIVHLEYTIPGEALGPSLERALPGSVGRDIWTVWIIEYDALCTIFFNHPLPATSIEDMRADAATHQREMRDPKRRIPLTPPPPAVDPTQAPATGATWDDARFERFRAERCREYHRRGHACYCERCRTPTTFVPIEVVRIEANAIDLFEDRGTGLPSLVNHLHPGQTHTEVAWRSEPVPNTVTAWAEIATLSDSAAWAALGRITATYQIPGEAHDTHLLDQLATGGMRADLECIWAQQLDETFTRRRLPRPPIASLDDNATDLDDRRHRLLRDLRRER